MPSASTIAKWARQAPADFRFAFKVPRTITHELRLHGPAPTELRDFLRAIETHDPARVSGEDGTRALELALAIREQVLAGLRRIRGTR